MISVEPRKASQENIMQPMAVKKALRLSRAVQEARRPAEGEEEKEPVPVGNVLLGCRPKMKTAGTGDWNQDATILIGGQPSLQQARTKDENEVFSGSGEPVWSL